MAFSESILVRERLLTGAHYEGWILVVALGKPPGQRMQYFVVKYLVLGTGQCWPKP